MYTEGFKPPRPGGVNKKDEWGINNVSNREVDSRITPYRNPVEPEYKYRDIYYDEVCLEIKLMISII